MALENRIRALERKILSDPVVLRFADGSTKQIRGHGNYLLDLYVGSCRAELSPLQLETVDLIRQSVSAEEPGGGRMTELLRICPDGRQEMNQDPSRDVSAQDEDTAPTLNASGK